MNNMPRHHQKVVDPWSDEFVREFGDWLQQHNHLTRDAVRRAAAAARQSGERFDLALSRLGLISDDRLVLAAAEFLNLPVITAKDIPDRPLPLSGLDPNYLRRSACLPIREDDTTLVVALQDPFNLEPVSVLAFHLGRQIRPVIGTATDISKGLELCYGRPSEVHAAMLEADANSGNIDDVRRLTDLASEAPIIRLVNEIIQKAIDADASDIHLEPFAGGLVARYRIDGELSVVREIAAQHAAAVVSRVKIMARLDIAVHRLPQDGQTRANVRGRDVDLRVSIMPTSRGESVVLRILDRSRVALEFPALGFSPDTIATFTSFLERPNGLLLVTGPTGSGKSTTLYTALRHLSLPSRKIFTIEDPVENEMAGVSQVQVHPSVGLTFAHALRSILRQDPDVIMVGEIRDFETAQMALQAALTGHLVLATLHTNSAIATISRLVDMGLADYLIASTLKASLAQRLVRRLCRSCSRPGRVTPTLAACAASIDPHRHATLWRGDGVREPVGCEACRQTGYRGRVAIAELLKVDESVARAITRKDGSVHLATAAAASGLRPMLADGLDKVFSGETTLEEVLRVVRDV